ncbi:MAG: hypothetical protein IKP41_02515 [Bacteroidaceae bacterium]|nr:hypothetical protein [Bacteroidaceae bacterium]
MANDYFQSKDFKELLKSYEEQRERGESIYLDADDFADIADYYLSVDKPELSMETIDRGLAIHGDDEVLMIVQGAAYIYQRQFGEAEEVLKQLDATNPDVMYQWAQIEYAKNNHVRKAEKRWREWMKAESGEEQPSEGHRRENYIHIISSLIELRRDEEGEKAFDVETVRRWIREYIDVFQPLGRYDEDVQMADICRENELADLMCEILTQVLEEQPYLPKGWANLGLAQYMLQRYSEAIESCDFALAVKPNDTEAMLTKAHSLFSMGEKIASIPVFKEYLDKGGDKLQLIPYADALFLKGDKKAGSAALKKLMSYYENERLSVALQLINAEDTLPKDSKELKAAQEDYAEMVDLYKRVMTDVSDIYHSNGCYKDSIKANKMLTECDPQDSEAYFMLGINNLAIHEYEEASRNFALALQWADDQVMMGVDIALTFVLNNFDKFALEVLDAVSKIAPKSKSPFAKNIPAAKSLTYLKMGYKDQFLQFFRTACQDTPELVAKVYEGYFPKNLPVSQWGDYAMKNINKLINKLRNDDRLLPDFS